MGSRYTSFLFGVILSKSRSGEGAWLREKSLRIVDELMGLRCCSNLRGVNYRSVVGSPCPEPEPEPEPGPGPGPGAGVWCMQPRWGEEGTPMAGFRDYSFHLKWLHCASAHLWLVLGVRVHALHHYPDDASALGHWSRSWRNGPMPKQSLRNRTRPLSSSVWLLLLRIHFLIVVESCEDWIVRSQTNNSTHR